MSDPLLTIGYSVLDHRAADVRLPPQRPDTEVLVVVQGNGTGAPPRREDVRVLELPGTGVARSRNAVLDAARGEMILFADDDVSFRTDGVRRLVEEFLHDPSLALAQGVAVDETGRLRKRYTTRSRDLRRWNSAKAATYEIMVRRRALAAAGVRFDETFGAGVPRYLGDEYVLIADALAAGLSCRAFPHVLAVHPRESSGAGYGTARDAAARSAVFDRVYGRAAPVARLAFAARRPRRFGGPALMLRFVSGRFPA